MKIETTLEQMRKDEVCGYGDWHYVFAYAAQPTHQPTGKGAPGFHVTGVAEVLASVEGETGPTGKQVRQRGPSAPRG